MTPHYYQANARQAIFDYFENGGKGNPLVCMGTGCHAKDTEILMYNGSIKLVQDVQVGDLLMGPDSKPRTVLNLARGREKMVKITPVKGQPFIVNENHILSLYKTSEGDDFECRKTRIENVKVFDYMNASKSFKHVRKLRRVAVDFPTIPSPTIDPWIIGAMLGDGSTKFTVCFTNADSDVIEKICNYAIELGCDIRKATKPNNKASSYYFPHKNSTRTIENPFTKLLRDNGIGVETAESKHIPSIFKYGSVECRKQVLAGLIDTDGHLDVCGGVDFISKSKILANDLVFICRSLGLAAYSKECQKGCQNGFVGTYHRVFISGDLTELPLVRKHRIPEKRKQKKDVLVCGFTCEYLPEDNYYGFTLSGDHLYLTSDFIVHHNTGKSIVIADFLKEVFRQFPDQRVMMLTHVWKLIQQNADKMYRFWPGAPIGIHSAGLKQRDTVMPIIFGGVQSVAKNPEAFGHRDLLLIDEAHLLGADEDSQYLKVIAALTKINPRLKVIGFTATPYRLKMGSLLDGGLFSDICYDITTHEWFQRLISEGYLSPLVGKPTNTRIDGISNLSIVAGDFNAKQSEALIDTENITYSACQEILEYGYNRNKCMVFAAGVNNSEHIASCLQSMGASAAAVHSKLTSEEVKARLAAFERGEIWALVGANMFTTGYDEPRIDLIADLQPTCSPGKHVQKLGRGTRVYRGQDWVKANCLILDFAGNISRNGPIDDPVLPRKPGQKTGDAPIKFCESIRLEANQNLKPEHWQPGCGAYNHASARFCCNCAAAFSFSTKLFATARSDAPMKQDETPIIELVKIKPPVFYAKNLGKDKGSGFISPPTVKVTYTLGLRPINVFLCFEHTGKARRLAHEWWQRHAPSQPPATVDEFLSRTDELRIPKEVRVHVNKQYPSIESYEF